MTTNMATQRKSGRNISLHSKLEYKNTDKGVKSPKRWACLRDSK